MEKYQTLWRRVGALVLDSFVLIPINLIVSFVFILVTEDRVLLKASTGGFVAVLYYILMHYYYGQTVGKMVTKVKVLDESEKPISFGQSILRSLPQLIPVMFAVSFSTADNNAGSPAAFWGRTIITLSLTFSLIDALVCASSAKNRAIHDMLAGTIVVRTDV
jgi:uncharacterized RDD family membrane protein YckC